MEINCAYRYWYIVVCSQLGTHACGRRQCAKGGPNLVNLPSVARTQRIPAVAWGVLTCTGSGSSPVFSIEPQTDF